jgi:glucose-1-phosphate cytidylyltransferase
VISISDATGEEPCMKTVILCGGYGTRIRDVAEDLPKPMIPVGRLPILWHLMKYYAHFGHNDFVLCLGYKSHVIKDFFLNYEARTRDCTVTLGSDSEIIYHTKHDELNWKVTLADTGTESMTGARIRKIQQYVKDERFFLTYGDGLSNIDLHQLLAFHEKSGKTLTVTGVRPPGRFGELRSDESGIVTEFNEKPQATGGRISGGFFVCEPKLFDVLPAQDNLVFEEEPLRALVKQRELAVYEHDDFWQCMDTYRDWQLLNGLLADGKAPWEIW